MTSNIISTYDRSTSASSNVLVVGANGKSGRRVRARLEDRSDEQLRIRAGSRSADPAFDWTERSGWPAVLEGIDAVYLSYVPDLSVPGAQDDIAAFTEIAATAGVGRIVLLSGRGEPGSQVCEQIIRDGTRRWTVLRCAWFMQNFSEFFLVEPINAGDVALPVAEVTEPFVDLEDVADIAAQALVGDDHLGRTYELTGPRSITFADAVAEISRATGRVINYQSVALDDYLAELAGYGLPDERLELYGYLFGELLDGRNTTVADGVRQALGRDPGSFSAFAVRTAATGVWQQR